MHDLSMTSTDHKSECVEESKHSACLMALAQRLATLCLFACMCVGRYEFPGSSNVVWIQEDTEVRPKTNM